MNPIAKLLTAALALGVAWLTWPVSAVLVVSLIGQGHASEGKGALAKVIARVLLPVTIASAILFVALLILNLIPRETDPTSIIRPVEEAALAADAFAKTWRPLGWYWLVAVIVMLGVASHVLAEWKLVSRFVTMSKAASRAAAVLSILTRYCQMLWTGPA